MLALCPEAVLLNAEIVDKASDSVLLTIDEGAYELAAIFVVDLTMAVLFVLVKHAVVALISLHVMTEARHVTVDEIAKVFGAG